MSYAGFVAGAGAAWGVFIYLKMDLWRSTASVTKALDMGGSSELTSGRRLADQEDKLVTAASKLAARIQTEGAQRWNRSIDYLFNPVIHELARRGW